MTKQKILVVDDESEIVEVVTFLLRREGFEVITALNGIEALSKIATAGNVAAVICDLKMPKMDGLIFLKSVRETHSLLPFIFLSGHAGSEEEHEMINYGTYEVIQKPHVNRVIPAIHKLLAADQDVKSMAGSKEAAEFLEILHSTGKKMA